MMSTQLSFIGAGLFGILKPMTVPKRDFIFIDEAGDPGLATDYFIMGVVHVTDISLRKLNVHLGALRYFASISKELKSTQLNPLQKEKLMEILRLAISDDVYVKASAVYVDKHDYGGNYLRATGDVAQDPTKFRHLIMRRLLEEHFKNTKPQTNEVEIVIDRFHSGEEKEQQLRSYLRTDKYNKLPKFLHIIQADSQYVELLQIADWISGSVKERFFTHNERDFKELFEYINVIKVDK